MEAREKVASAVASGIPRLVARTLMTNDWRLATLGDLCEFRAGAAFPPALQGHQAGAYPFIKVSDMNLPENATYIRGANNWIEEEALRQLRARPHPAGT